MINKRLFKLLWWNWLLYLAWPAFMTAALLEFTVFALVDPLELHLPGTWEFSRHTVYVLAFFVFWVICMLPGAMALFLAQGGVTDDPVPPEEDAAVAAGEAADAQ